MLTIPASSQALQRGPLGHPHRGSRSGRTGVSRVSYVWLYLGLGLLSLPSLFMAVGCNKKAGQDEPQEAKQKKRKKGAPRTKKGRKGPTRSEAKCLYRLRIHRRHSYLREVRSKPNTHLADFQKEFNAIPVDKTCEPISHTKEFQYQGAPLFCFDPKSKRAVVNSAVFSRLKSKHLGRVDDQFIVGEIKKEALEALSPAKVVKFLLRSQILLTYVHMHADLCATKQKKDQGSYRIDFDAKHVYFTNQKNVRKYRFSVEIKKEGKILIHR